MPSIFQQSRFQTNTGTPSTRPVLKEPVKVDNSSEGTVPQEAMGAPQSAFGVQSPMQAQPQPQADPNAPAIAKAPAVDKPAGYILSGGYTNPYETQTSDPLNNKTPAPAARFQPQPSATNANLSSNDFSGDLNTNRGIQTSAIDIGNKIQNLSEQEAQKVPVSGKRKLAGILAGVGVGLLGGGVAGGVNTYGAITNHPEAVRNAQINTKIGGLQENLKALGTATNAGNLVQNYAQDQTARYGHDITLAGQNKPHYDVVAGNLVETDPTTGKSRIVYEDTLPIPDDLKSFFPEGQSTAKKEAITNAVQLRGQNISSKTKIDPGLNTQAKIIALDHGIKLDETNDAYSQLTPALAAMADKNWEITKKSEPDDVIRSRKLDDQYKQTQIQNLNQEMGMRLTADGADSLADKVNDNPSLMTLFKPDDKDLVARAMSRKGYPIPVPKDLGPAENTRLFNAGITLKNIDDIREMLKKNPDSIGPWMGRIGLIEQSAGGPIVSTGDPAKSRDEQEFRTALTYLVANEAKALMGGRPASGWLEQFKAASANPKLSPSFMEGALRGAEDQAQNVQKSGFEFQYGNKFGEAKPPAQSAPNVDPNKLLQDMNNILSNGKSK